MDVNEVNTTKSIEWKRDKNNTQGSITSGQWYGCFICNYSNHDHVQNCPNKAKVQAMLAKNAAPKQTLVITQQRSSAKKQLLIWCINHYT